MSVTVTKASGVSVYTVTSDPQSSCLPLCQIMKGLCYNPVCCSVSQSLRKIQGSSQTILGVLHIMVGLLNIGFGVILRSDGGGSWWSMGDRDFPFWLGAVFVFFGIICILSEKYPSPCLVTLNVILNLAGVGFAIASILLYGINIEVVWVWLDCDDYGYEYFSRHQSTTQTPSPREVIMKEQCSEGREMTVMLLKSINAVLIVLSALELCLVISSAVMGIKALRRRDKGEDEKIADPEPCNPLLEKVTIKPVA